MLLGNFLQKKNPLPYPDGDVRQGKMKEMPQMAGMKYKKRYLFLIKSNHFAKSFQ